MTEPEYKDLLLLLDKAKTGTATQKEFERLVVMINADKQGETLNIINAFLEKENVTTTAYVEPYDREYWQQALDELKESIRNGKPQLPRTTHRVHFLRTSWFRYAAAVIIFLGLGAYLYYHNSFPKRNEAALATKSDVPAPTAVRATITLSNGKQVALDSLSDGVLAQEGNMQIEKLDDGRIIYKGTGDAAMAYNTISVPRGSRIASVTLSDGTVVFLNTASSLRYPVAFTGNERRVQITGEAYFEVAKDRSKKFVVESGDIATEVLGTHFNVNTYHDETAKAVTLLEGSIKVSNGPQSVMVRPGQQAVIQSNTIGISNNADINQVMAWKNGLFAFKDADIPMVMKQLGKWYDIEVVYEKGVPDVLFSGKMQRKLSLAQVVDVLNTMGVHCTIQGKRLIIKP